MKFDDSSKRPFEWRCVFITDECNLATYPSCWLESFKRCNECICFSHASCELSLRTDRQNLHQFKKTDESNELYILEVVPWAAVVLLNIYFFWNLRIFRCCVDFLLRKINGMRQPARSISSEFKFKRLDVNMDAREAQSAEFWANGICIHWPRLDELKDLGRAICNEFRSHSRWFWKPIKNSNGIGIHIDWRYISEFEWIDQWAILSATWLNSIRGKEVWRFWSALLP